MSSPLLPDALWNLIQPFDRNPPQAKPLGRLHLELVPGGGVEPPRY
jgi:hypothetical protein